MSGRMADIPYDEPRTALGADFAESAIFSPGLVFPCYRRESLQFFFVVRAEDVYFAVVQTQRRTFLLQRRIMAISAPCWLFSVCGGTQQTNFV